jgi:heme A synthase
MIILVGIFIGVILLITMSYMALKKQSNFSMRLASLIALAVMILTVIICVILVLMGGGAPVDESILLVVGGPAEQPTGNSNLLAVLILVLFLVVLFAIVFVLSMREHRKNTGNKNLVKPIISTWDN